MLKIIIAGNYGAGNIGDEMILEGILKILRDVLTEPEITVLSGNPKETEERHKVSAVEKFPAGIRSLIKSFFTTGSKTRKAVKECDYFILGGGGLFNGKDFFSNIIWGIQAFWAYHCKKSALMMGQSMDMPKSKIIKLIIKKLFNKACFISVRDENSKENLKKLGIRKKIYVTPDFAFELPFRKTEISDSVSREKYVLFALRQTKKLDQHFKTVIVEFINWLMDFKKLNIVLVNFQNTGRDSDDMVNEEIYKEIKDKEKIKFIKNTESSELLNLFANADFAVCMRFHAVVLAVKTETPFIALNYASKVEDFLKYAKLDNQKIDLNDLSQEKLKIYFDQFIRDQNLKRKMEEFNKNAARRLSELENLTLRNIFSSDR
ncbi:polysaccharide pyruvyl transferase family protein [Candidatus Peregrinibacteria bacterium]|nr:polysaccharide pyruvyl transferase family protein [Candidatus Peregrinibacteria bacterium]